MLPRFAHAPARALARALFDAGRGIPEARLDWMLADVDDFTGRAGAKTRLGFLAALLVLQWSPLFFGAWGRMSALTPEARDRYLERLDRSALAVLIALPKAVLGLCYYEHPEVVAELGYDGRPLITEGTALGYPGTP